MEVCLWGWPSRRSLDCFYCPMGQKMTPMGTVTKHTENGYIRTYTQYQAQGCQECPMRGCAIIRNPIGSSM